MKSKQTILYMVRKIDFKSPCRAAYSGKVLPVSLHEIDLAFGSFTEFYKAVQTYRTSGTTDAKTKED